MKWQTVNGELFPEFCYGLRELEMQDPSFTEVTPIIIRRGRGGYWLTDWKWGKKNARAALKMMNTKLGITPKVAQRMMDRSMFSWEQKKGKRK